MDDVRTIGVEEELLLVDPETREMSSRAREVIKQFREHGRGGEPSAASDVLDEELFRHQLEIRTDPVVDLDGADAQIRAARRTAGEAAESLGLATIACGIVPRSLGEVRVSPNDRYRDMVDTYGEVARHGGTCGMHVHVAIESAEVGVAVLDRIAPWLPVLVAISANSPFHDDRDTGYASWRAQVWQRWPSAGPSEAFGSVAGYRDACQFLIDSGAARDPGMLYFDARLAEDHPTVEIRVADVCTDVDDAVLVAALVRGLVEVAARDAAAGGEAPAWRAGALRACTWRAAKYGLSAGLLHPVDRQVRPAREVLGALLDHVHHALDHSGDLERGRRGVERVLGASGASLQRATYERHGSAAAVVDDLLERTRRSWDR